MIALVVIVWLEVLLIAMIAHARIVRAADRFAGIAANG